MPYDDLKISKLFIRFWNFFIAIFLSRKNAATYGSRGRSADFWKKSHKSTILNVTSCYSLLGLGKFKTFFKSFVSGIVKIFKKNFSGCSSFLNIDLHVRFTTVILMIKKEWSIDFFSFNVYLQLEVFYQSDWRISCFKNDRELNTIQDRKDIFLIFDSIKF